MNKSVLLLLSFMLMSYQIWAVDKVFYGNDDRQEIFQSTDQLMKDLSLSTAAQIPNELLKRNGDNWTLSGLTLKETGVCSTERFSNQLTSADCTGFLVAPDLLMTAGHCVKDLSDCQNNFWVFDYANKIKENNFFRFNATQMYRCTAIIKQVVDFPANKDFALVKLDRSAEGRQPFNLRKDGRINNDATLVVIGHPAGLPLKITGKAIVKHNNLPDYFAINSDTFTGNSGSPVIDSQSGIVEGILVRGDTDYVQAEGKNCRVVKVNQNNGGRGEDVIRITIPAQYLK